MRGWVGEAFLFRLNLTAVAHATTGVLRGNRCLNYSKRLAATVSAAATAFYIAFFFLPQTRAHQGSGSPPHLRDGLPQLQQQQLRGGHRHEGALQSEQQPRWDEPERLAPRELMTATTMMTMRSDAEKITRVCEVK